MKVNTLVYTHPINMYIIKHLSIPVETFCDLYGFKQGTVSSWITRNRTVENLPANFIYCLGLASSKSMDFVYQNLLTYQESFLEGKREKKRIES